MRWNFLKRNFWTAAFVSSNRSKYPHEHDYRAHIFLVRI
jgi:hypothetical protein